MQCFLRLKPPLLWVRSRLQVFGRRYYEQMPSMGLKSADAAYVLAFSVIMLNTDLHNNQVRRLPPRSSLGLLPCVRPGRPSRAHPCRRPCWRR